MVMGMAMRKKQMSVKKVSSISDECPDCGDGRYCSVHCVIPRKNGRPSWDEYFLQICDLVATRATCQRLKVGAVLVKDRKVLSTGYCGSPKGTPDCFEEGCYMVDNHCIRTVHAEVNAVVQAAYNGTSTQDSTVYVNNLPCYQCAKVLINAGVIKMVYRRDYRPDPTTHKLLKEAKVKLMQVEESK